MSSRLHTLAAALVKDLKRLDRMLTLVKNAAPGPAEGGAADKKLAEAILLLAQSTAKAEAMRKELPS